MLNGNPIEVETRNDIIQKRQFFDKKQSIDSFAEEFATLSVASKKYISSVRNYKNNIQIEDNCALSSLGFVLQKKVDCRVKKAMLDVSNDKKQAELSNAKQLFFADSKTSISELECYFSCPYKHFAEYGLKIKERDEAKLKAVDVGNIMHKIAELFMRQISSFEKLEEKEFDKKVLSLVEYVMSQEKVSVAANKQIVAPLKSEAQRLCNALLYQYKNSSFRSSPEESEMRFGNGGTASGVKLKNGISIEGKIDRVDTTDKYLRVIDYKTGEYKLSASEVYYGKKIQLFVYLKALEKYKNLRLVGAFYFPIKDNFVEEKEENNYLDTYRLDGYYEKDVDAVKSMDNSLSFENPSSKIVNASISKSKENIKCGNFVLNSVKTTVVACGMISKINAYVKELAETATSEILDGFILPSPIFKDRLACDYCKYKLACGFSENAGDEPRIAQSSIKFENFVKEEEWWQKNLSQLLNNKRLLIV